MSIISSKPRKQQKNIPIWPMNAVSTSEAIGSAVKAIAAGSAIDNISRPRLSDLKTSLHIKKKINRDI